MPESSGAVTRRVLALWTSRARSLRNVCAFAFVPFAALALVGVVANPAGQDLIIVLAVFALPSAAFFAGAVAATRRPFAVAVALALAASVAEGLSLYLVIRSDRPPRVAWILVLLSGYWPLSFSIWAIELLGADRWIRLHADAWRRVRRDASALAATAAGSTADGIVLDEGEAGVPPSRRFALVLRVFAAPLGAGLLVIGVGYVLFLCVPAVREHAIAVLSSVGLDE